MTRYIWNPKGYRNQKMHYQATTFSGDPLNASLCGIVYSSGFRTINPPFGLGRGICKHCHSALNRNRAIPANVLPAMLGESP